MSCLHNLSVGVAAQVQDAARWKRKTAACAARCVVQTMFRSYTAGQRVAPVYSWDAAMALNLTVRCGRLFHEFPARSNCRTENIGSRVSVGGTGYLLGIGYAYTRSTDFTVSAGIVHLSSHLAKDLDEKLEELAIEGTTVPSVDDPSEYNVFYFAAYRRLPSWRLTPEFEIAVEPMNFSFTGAPAGYVRPLYLGTRWTLWQSNQASLVARTQHEIGENPFNYFSLSLAMLRGTNQPEGRFQIFLGASPGHEIHVSPNIGALRMASHWCRMAFRARNLLPPAARVRFRHRPGPAELRGASGAAIGASWPSGRSISPRRSRRMRASRSGQSRYARSRARIAR